MGIGRDEFVEIADNSLDICVRLFEASDDRVSVVRVPHNAALENYARGKLNFHVHLIIREFGEYCIVIEGLLAV